MYEQTFFVTRKIGEDEHELSLKITFEMEIIREADRWNPSEGGAEIKTILLVHEDGKENVWEGTLTAKEESDFCLSAYEGWVEYQDELRAEAAMDFHEDRAMAYEGKGEIYW